VKSNPISIAGRDVPRLLILLIVSFLSAIALVDYVRLPNESLQPGDVAPRTVKAPFTFTYTDFDLWEADRERARAAAPMVYLWDDAYQTATRERVRSAFQLARSAEKGGQRDAFVQAINVHLAASDLEMLDAVGYDETTELTVLALMDKATTNRFILSATDTFPPRDRVVQIVPRLGDREPFVLEGRESVLRPEAARRVMTVDAMQLSREGASGAALGLASALIQPNLVHDPARTVASADAAEAEVTAQATLVKRGAILFREGDVLSADQIERYSALQESRGDGSAAFELVAITVFVFMLWNVLVGFGRTTGSRFDDRPRNIAAVGLIFVAVVWFSKVVVLSADGVATLIGYEAERASVYFLAPLAAGAMLIRLVIGSSWSLIYAIAAGAAAGLMMDNSSMYGVYFALTSLVGAGVMSDTQERMTVLRAGALVGVFGALLVLVEHFVAFYGSGGELSLATTIRPVWSMGFALVGGLLAAFLVLGSLPLMELFGFVTDFQLMELARLNHPAMRKLMLRAPGTYHHSVIVGSLAEAGCEAIGAKSLQAKIAAYFHDIGKAEDPAAFIENQGGGTNPHNALPAVESARRIISHVTEGARIAQEIGLPKPIVDNIYMHHGTGLLQYFFTKAQMETDPDTVDEADFRYPGPKPNSREAGVIMLADKVEAATRTIKNPTEANIRAMIARILNSVLADGQFDDCPLTVAEIATVVDTFVNVLIGIYHQRIAYPDTADLSGKEQAPVRPTMPKGDADDDTDYESVMHLPHGS